MICAVGVNAFLSSVLCVAIGWTSGGASGL